MKLVIVQVEDCPNAPLLGARLVEASSAREDVAVEHVVVHDEDEAAVFGMTGSPTLLVDGIDPFASPGAVASLACRVYRTGNGEAVPVPSVAQLRTALRPREPLAIEQWLAGATVGRHTTLPDEVRAMHRVVLRHFVDTGQPPSRAWLAIRAGTLGIDADAAVAQLASADLVHIGADARVVVAYPFSGTPTAHRVHLADGPAVWSMCAIDALGIPQMTDRDAVISSREPGTDVPIRVEVRGAEWSFDPPSTVVLMAQSGTQGTSALCVCGHVNFYADAARAHAYLENHPQLSGAVIDQATAVTRGGEVFGDLLREENPSRQRT